MWDELLLTQTSTEMQQQLLSLVSELGENSSWNMHCVIFDTNLAFLLIRSCVLWKAQMKTHNLAIELSAVLECVLVHCELHQLLSCLQIPSNHSYVHLYLINLSTTLLFCFIQNPFPCDYSRLSLRLFFSICKIRKVQIKSFLITN